MPKDKRKAIGAGVIAGVIGLAYLLTREKPVIPPEILPEEILPEVPEIPILANLYGTVIDAKTGEPIPMVMVETAYAITQTETLGDYTLTLDIGTHSIEFRKEGYYSKVMTITLTEAGKKVDVRLKPVPPVVVFSGIVIDTLSRQPLPGVRVEVLNKVTQTDTRGEYYFEELPLLETGAAVKYTKSGYYGEVRSIYIIAGYNQLNVEMLSTTKTGFPTDEEIVAVKARVRIGLDTLGWDPCADIHYTPAMNNQITQVLEPIRSLQQRGYKEIEKLREQCLIDNKYYELGKQMEEIQAIQSRLHALDTPYLTAKRSDVCSVRSDGIVGFLELLWGSMSCTASDHSLSTRPVTLVYELLSREEKELVDTHNAVWGEFGGIYLSYFSYSLYYRKQGLFEGRGVIADKCWQTDLKRKIDMLVYRVWYCGYSLGY